MKPQLYITIYLLLLTGASFAQYSNITRVKMDASEIPDAVKRAQRLAFSEGFVTGWKFHTKERTITGDTSYYMASFKKRGSVGNSSFFNTDGDLLSYVLYIDSRDVPEAIKNEATSRLENSFIKSAELIDLENPKRMIYRIRLQNTDGALKYVYYDINGQFINKRKLPFEIFVFI